MQRLTYIHNNSVKRGYVDLPEHWRYSSARSYMGEESLLPIVLLSFLVPKLQLGNAYRQALLDLST